MVSLVLGVLLLLGCAGAATGGAVLLWADQTQRDEARYISIGTESYRSSGHALRFEPVDIRWDRGLPALSKTIRDVRLRAASEAPGTGRLG